MEQLDYNLKYVNSNFVKYSVSFPDLLFFWKIHRNYAKLEPEKQ